MTPEDGHRLSRRHFIETAAAGAGLAALGAADAAAADKPAAGKSTADKPAPLPGGALPAGPLSRPVAISTWRHGVAASRIARDLLAAGGTPLDAVERGINEVEKDPRVDSVGVGGMPNENGDVELDAAIMDGSLRCGSVMSLRGIATPISVARKVMERTRHIQLVGEGALKFALSQGFQKVELPTPEARAKWEKWRSSPDRKVPGQVSGPQQGNIQKGDAKQSGSNKSDSHDTVSLLVLGSDGKMAAGCSTSGLAWKMAGRVGDSPIVGGGLYCDGEIGAAGATGIGEEILRVCGSFLIVEGLRRGLKPQAAVDEALRRVVAADPANRQRQVAFIALSRSGEVGAGAMLAGFQAAIATGDGREVLIDVPAFAG